jgi:hypothetical protein
MSQDSDNGACLPGSFLEAAASEVVYLRNCVQCAILKVEEMARTGTKDGTVPTELRVVLKDLREISKIAIKEEDRLADELKRSNGGLHPGAFDLAAAHAEIGRRLAELRRARDHDTVSGEPE